MRRIKLLRMSAGYSQWSISREIGISQGKYSLIERGLIEPTADERMRLATILRASAATLFRPAVRDSRNPACATVF